MYRTCQHPSSCYRVTCLAGVRQLGVHLEEQARDAAALRKQLHADSERLRQTVHMFAAQV